MAVDAERAMASLAAAEYGFAVAGKVAISAELGEHEHGTVEAILRIDTGGCVGVVAHLAGLPFRAEQCDRREDLSCVLQIKLRNGIVR